MIKKLLKILDPNEKKFLIILFFIVLFSTFLEILSLSALIPILNVFIDKNFLTEVNKIINFQLDYNSFIKYSLILIFVLYILKNIIQIIFNIFIAKFATDVGRNVSGKILSNFLNRDILKLNNLNSSEIIRNVINEPNFVFSFIFSSLNFIIELFVLTGILIFLFYYNPTNTLFMMSVLFLISLILITTINKKIKFASDTRIKNDRIRLEILQTIIKAIKEIKLYNKIVFFKKMYLKPNFLVFNSQKKLRIFLSLPRNLIELTLILLLGFFIFLSASFGKNYSEIFMLLIVFAAAILRILPSISRILVSFQSMTSSFRSIKVIYDFIEFGHANKNKDKSIKQVKISEIKDLRVKNLYFKYNSKDNYVLRKLNLKFMVNKINIIYGPSGSGKSTLINLLLGFLIPQKGKILVNNLDLRKCINSWQNVISYMPQNTTVFNDTLKNNIIFGEKLNKIKYKKSILLSQIHNLKKIIYNNKFKAGENGSNLSGGQVQRVGIARALYRFPKIIILDEPTNSLDNKNDINFFKNLKKLKTKVTVIVISHNARHLRFADNLINLGVLNAK